jgi:hypothetical protein
MSRRGEGQRRPWSRLRTGARREDVKAGSGSLVGRRKPPFVADLDSATVALQATANFLHGRDWHPLGSLSRWAPIAAPVLDVLPGAIAEWMYSWGGWIDALPARVSATRGWTCSSWSGTATSWL